MRTSLLVAATALVLSACSPVAQGALESDSSDAAVSPSPSASLGASPLASPSPPAASTASTLPPAMPSVSSPSATGPFDDPAPVGSFVLGDSISLSPEVGPVLGRYGYQVVGLVGQSVTDAYLTTHLSSGDAQRAPGWVIVLGTNNGGTEADVARLEHWVDLIDSLRTPGLKQRVRWVTPYRPVDRPGSMQVSELDAFNAELARLAVGRPWLRLLDFASLAKANPEWFDEDPALRVHPNADGQAAVVALIAGSRPVEAPNTFYPSNAAIEPEPAPDPDLDLDQAFDNDELEEDLEEAAPDRVIAPSPAEPSAEPPAEPTPTPSPETDPTPAG